MESREWLGRVRLLAAVASLWTATAACPLPDRGAPEGTTNADSVAAAAEQEFILQFLTSPCDTVLAPWDNEVHDCQRLVREGATPGQPEFGPLVGILPEPATMALPADAYTTPRVAAWVVNAGSLSGAHDYTALGITGDATSVDDPTAHCLWLRSSRDSQEWQAALVRASTSDDPDCGEPPPDSTWSLLTVVRQTRAGATPSDYPPTARWQWTGGASPATAAPRSTHYIGVRCGDGWCAIGEPSFTPVDIPPSPTPVHRAIPGWFDAQYLAAWRRTGPDSVLVPGPWGEVYPEWDLPSDSMPAWETFTPVAHFRLSAGRGPSGGVGPYLQKLNAAPPTGPQATAFVELRVSPILTGHPEGQYGNGSTGSTMRMADTVVVGPMPHGPARSARWRWHEADETAWVPCPIYGCCDVQEADFF